MYGASRTSRFAIAVAVIFLSVYGLRAFDEAAYSEPLKHAAKSGRWTYLLTCQNSDTPIEIKVVKQADIKKELPFDLAGVRLWADSSGSLQNIRKQVADPVTARRFLTGTVNKMLCETGVLPDAAPVCGEEGKKLGVDGMVFIAGGEFVRTGEFWESTGGGLNDKPSRGDKYRVRVSAFYIDKFKVTNEDYCKFLNDGNARYATLWNPRITRSALDPDTGKFVPSDRSLAKNPVVLVNWYQAKGYAAWAGKRLATEAEWEFAAGGTEGRTYPWGNEPPDKTRADFPVQYLHTVPVDWFPNGATPEGVCQMAGNSAEWCADYFDIASYVQAPAGGVLINPKGPKQGFDPASWYKFRMMFKGWCKGNRADLFTCTKRHGRPPFEDADGGISFRCVKDASQVR